MKKFFVLLVVIGFGICSTYAQNVEIQDVHMNSGSMRNGNFVESLQFSVHVKLTGDLLTYLNNGGAVSVTISCGGIGMLSCLQSSSETITIDKRYGGQADFGKGYATFTFSNEECRDSWKNYLSVGNFVVYATKE
ncbi:MAG: hypothetical protein PHP83_03000 [Clostridia bacterium]|nr:hypothetical protein [Clostridia bacterium]